MLHSALIRYDDFLISLFQKGRKHTLRNFLKQILLVFAFSSLHLSNSVAQESLKDSISGSLNLSLARNLREKIFVHLDRTFYIRGETMWFSLWTVNGANNKPMDLSKVSYVEVLDEQSQPVLKAKIPLKDGHGEGSIDIPSTIISGNFTFRAYTAYMKNFDPTLFYQQKITIINVEKRPALRQEKNKSVYKTDFFPEGGQLVNGIRAKIGFKATDKKGRGVPFTGFLLNSSGDTLKKFNPYKFGMGHFIFTPSVNEKYRAVWIFNDSTKVINTLPEVAREGYSLRLFEKADQSISLNVYAQGKTSRVLTEEEEEDGENEGDEGLLLVYHNNDSVLFKEQKYLINGRCTFKIDRNNLAPGISCFTIFNSQHKPVCERKYFAFPKDSLQASLAMEEIVAPQAKVNMQLQLSGFVKDTVEKARLSMAVYLLDSLQGIPETTITNYLWLTSEIRGFIESPSFYFNNSEDAKKAMENLLLTQGWTGFDSQEKKEVKSTALEYLPEMEKPYLQAEVFDRRTGLPAGDIKAYLTIPHLNNYFYASKSNQQGGLVFPLNDFENSREIILQLDHLGSQDYEIKTKDDFSKRKLEVVNDYLNTAIIPRKDIQQRFINANVQAAFGVQAPIETYQRDSAQRLFYGVPDKTYLLDDYTRFTTMEEVLREYVMEVAVRKRKGKYVCFVSNQNGLGLFEEEPLYLLDGLPVFDADQLIRYDPKFVKKIEVVTHKYFLGPLVSQGILSLLTYRRDLNDFKLDSSAIVMDFQGLAKKRKFYAPFYEQATAQNIPDFRNLLYWNPGIEINSTANISFFTAAQAGRYAVVVNGIDNSGRTVAFTKVFEVRKEPAH